MTIESGPRSGILTILGPTSVGKTRVALLAAERIGGEIVSADSRQIYRGLDIGTAKPTPSDRARIAHHLIDIADPSDTYDAARFATDAERVIGELLSRGVQPVVVGGTGFYIASLFDGFFEGPGRDEAVRGRLRARVESSGTSLLHEELTRIDPETAERLHPNDAARVIRALEVYEISGTPLSEWQAGGRRRPAYVADYFGLVRARSELYARVDDRVDSMMEAGLLAEVRGLVSSGGLSRGMPAANAVGYRELVDFIDGKHGDLEEAVELIKRSTRHYAKRQLTWFAGVENVAWIDVGSAGDDGAADEIVSQWKDNRARFC